MASRSTAGETGRPDDRRAAGSSFSPRQRISPSKESRTAQIGNPETQENRDPHRLSCKIDYFLRPNHGERSIASKFFTDDYIPKSDGRLRPLAVAALEDKIVQRATVAVLNAIYEEDFLGFSYGFRAGRGPHDALDALEIGRASCRERV